MKIIPVTCAIIQFANKTLTVQRSETMKLPLKWEFAGGKIEFGESEIDCIKREIFEELNIHISIKKRLTPVIHQYPNFKIKLIPFVAEYVSGELKLKEHCNYIFANKEELTKLDWAEADLPILKEFIEL
ncbi:(deoxy)nucleoside triphosphate pyrophosphohydrolase [Polaribacter litorisediminis]|uniref:(deoxy)nucleoside triphosphate pyrophosphohydrolase n=1 Tax=Polaribacter litorisediminis TaxID=1908341 RepID=UPI001CBBFA66|nr:(deoxy)nucleoside triphosphate pyrophosphohydrolase [Polaribacter litorisediminis]UAM98578.1 (deoxy)nucleoside triphosphate pyrophosphohydrolase [Polaribacter litorisediminis]